MCKAAGATLRKNFMCRGKPTYRRRVCTSRHPARRWRQPSCAPSAYTCSAAAKTLRRGRKLQQSRSRKRITSIPLHGRHFRHDRPHHRPRYEDATLDWTYTAQDPELYAHELYQLTPVLFCCCAVLTSCVRRAKHVRYLNMSFPLAFRL